MAALSLLGCGRFRATTLIASALAALVITLLWKGQGVGRGVRPGLAAGLAPLLLPLCAQVLVPFCGGGSLVFLVACVGGGALGGLLVAAACARAGDDVPRLDFLGSAFAVAALAGSLGCLVAGLGGVVGMGLGLALGATPLLMAPLAGRP